MTSTRNAEPGCRRCGFGRRVSAAAASILPGAVLVVLPKCPLCLAAWLTIATGLSFSATGAARIRIAIAVFWVVVVALVAARTWRHRINSAHGAGDTDTAN